MTTHLPTLQSSSDTSTGSGVRISMEIFPPKTDAQEDKLADTMDRLAAFSPDFVSVTYGAGGSTRDRTLKTIRRIRETSNLPVAMHLTCVGASRAVTDDIAREAWEAGVRHIVALRGDPETGVGTQYIPHPDGYQTSYDLIAGLKTIADFEISVSAYPERHPESNDWATELEFLKRKRDAGADRAITQFFFDNAHYERYANRVADAGLDIPIVPGILPIHDIKQVSRFAAGCGASIPDSVRERLAGLEDQPEVAGMVAASIAAEQLFDLADRGVDEFHLYTLNRADLTSALCRLMGRLPEDAPLGRAA